MSKGENIFKRKDGRWEARYIRGYELSGKIKYGFCYGKTYKEAKEKVTKFKAAIVDGSPPPATDSRHRFAFYCDEWLQLRKAKVKEATHIKYDTALNKHIKPRLGGCFPLGLSSGLVDDFTKELLLEEELAPKTVHDILVVLHGVLKYTAARFPRIFPAVEINYPKCSRKETRVLSREEQRRFVAYLLTDMDTCKFGVLLTLFTGVRIANLLQKTLPVMHMPDLPWKERAYILWKRSWDFILQRPEDCAFYPRYYYSASYRAHAYERHLACFKPLIEEVSKSFKPGTNMDMLVHQIFFTMLFYASCFLDGELENSEAATQWAFEQIYSFVVPNVKAEVLGEEVTL